MQKRNGRIYAFSILVDGELFGPPRGLASRDGNEDQTRFILEARRKLRKRIERKNRTLAKMLNPPPGAERWTDREWLDYCQRVSPDDLGEDED